MTLGSVAVPLLAEERPELSRALPWRQGRLGRRVIRLEHPDAQLAQTLAREKDRIAKADPGLLGNLCQSRRPRKPEWLVDLQSPLNLPRHHAEKLANRVIDHLPGQLTRVGPPKAGGKGPRSGAVTREYDTDVALSTKWHEDHAPTYRFAPGRIVGWCEGRTTGHPCHVGHELCQGCCVWKFRRPAPPKWTTCAHPSLFGQLAQTCKRCIKIRSPSTEP